MELIKVTPELLIAKANEVRSLKTTHDETIKDIRSLVLWSCELNPFGRTKAMDDYIAKFESLLNDLTAFSQMLDSYAKWLEATVSELLIPEAQLNANDFI